MSQKWCLFSRHYVKINHQWFCSSTDSHNSFCRDMVARVSPNCTRAAAISAVSFLLSLQAITFARAVIDEVSSQEFIISPLIVEYEVNIKRLKKGEFVY